jgi:hypothetical protein
LYSAIAPMAMGVASERKGHERNAAQNAGALGKLD